MKRPHWIVSEVDCCTMDATDPDRRIPAIREKPAHPIEEAPIFLPPIERATVTNLLDRRSMAKPQTLTRQSGARVALSTLEIVVRAVEAGADRQPAVRRALRLRGIRVSHVTVDRYLRILASWGVITRTPIGSVYAYAVAPHALARLESAHAAVA